MLTKEKVINISVAENRVYSWFAVEKVYFNNAIAYFKINTYRT